MGRMGTENRYDHQVSRAKWTPDDEQEKLLVELRRVMKAREDADAEYRKTLAVCADVGIPIARLAEEGKVERKTIYRHLGRSMT